MKEMKLADDGSTGACETSTFHQLVRGNSGSGPGSTPLSVAAAAATPSAQTNTIVAGRRDPRAQIISVLHRQPVCHATYCGFCVMRRDASTILSYDHANLLVSDRSRTCRSELP